MRRSLLFFPGNNPGMLLNADLLGSDSIIIDLEDAVSPTEKDSARILVRNALKTLKFKRSEVIVRINSIDTSYWKEDLKEIIPLKPAAILPPKINTAKDVTEIDEYITELEKEHGMEVGTVKLVPLIETTMGVENAFSIASSCDRVEGLFLGAEDLTADMRCIRTKESAEIMYSRSRLVTAARAAGVEVYDTPFTDVDDDAGLIHDAEVAKSMGFSGKASISPRHVIGINKVFSPTEKEIEYAYRVFEVIEEAKAAGKGVVSLNGKMIDAPIVERARQVIEMAKAISGGAVNE